MHFDLIDSVLERSDEAIVTIKLVTSGEEYLRDHFAGYPVLPGVFMLEAMVQAARRLESEADGPLARLCVGSVRALKYGSFVRPGQVLRVSVERVGELSFKGRGEVLEAALGENPQPLLQTACSGRFTLRKACVEQPSIVGTPTGGA